MARYESRKGSRYGPGGSGSRRDSKSGRRGSRYDRYGRGGAGEEDEYEEELPYYGEPAKRKLSHEQITLIIFGAIVGIILIALIVTMAGGSFGVPRGAVEREAGITGPKAVEREQRSDEEAAGRLLLEAESFDRANQYEEKEIVAAEYAKVYGKYPNTKAAQDARKMHDGVMDRRR